jgi:hypothetical protein
MSKLGSNSQRGGATERGLDTTRWRRRGTVRLARSTMSARTLRSGDRSSSTTEVMVLRSIGLCSMVHMSLSASLMRAS